MMATELVLLPRANGSKQSAVEEAYTLLRGAARRESYPEYSVRLRALSGLAEAVRRRTPDLVAAADADFGGRSESTTKLGDVATMLRELEYQKSRLRRWMAPERRSLALHFRPARGEVQFQPLGVVGVIAPWNYPFRLALGPLAAALAAGNRVLLKPSDHTPRCAALMRELIGQAGLEDHAAVVLGDEQVSRELSRLPLDHLFFTGSTSVGRRVLRAASENLVPVTLELGGKCPVVVHAGASIERAARRIVAGKFFNAGQTCVAPDHVWVPRTELARARTALAAEIRKQYPTLLRNPDYTAIINPSHLKRLERLVSDARARGALVEVMNPAGERFEAPSRKLPPTLISGVSPEMAVAHEEIFGPLLPIRAYDDLEEVYAELAESPSPLAAYYFDDDPRRAAEWLRRTRTGGACINDVMLHGLQDDLPFGGVGASGMGRYHGREGFLTFSHQRTVFHQARRNWAELLVTPYGPLAQRLIDWLAR